MTTMPLKQPVTAVRVARIFDAPRERVFSAWTEPEQIGRWFGPRSYSMRVKTMDLSPGGAYEFIMSPLQGETPSRSIVGKFHEITRPSRLQFSWAWQDRKSECGVEVENDSVVTVEFHERGDRTEVVVVHEQLETPEAREAHAGGWQATLDSLQAYLD